DTRYVMFMVVITSTLVLVIPTYLAVVVLGYGLMVPWITFSAYIIVLSFMFFFRFLGGKWKSMRVIEMPGAGERTAQRA
ncbi:MAG: MATE family efflux transporter, partial [Deltaproteobacteria bacterium]|nr:MATE family efflux transporter [Candidatus Desulfacyla euxinica]